MPIKLGDKLCWPAGRLRAFCYQRDIPVTPWEGRANLFTVPAGRDPGTGAVLLDFADLRALGTYSDHTLTFSDDAGELPLQRLTITRATCVVPGAGDDDARVYLVELADRRFHLLRSQPVNRSYNVVKKAGPVPEYVAETTNGGAGTPYTWQALIDSLWSLAGNPPGDKTLTFTPGGTPQNFAYHGDRSAWWALNDVVERLGYVIDYDPVVDRFAIVQAGSEIEPLDVIARARIAGYDLTWDAQPFDGNRGGRPATVRVFFRLRTPPDTGESPYVFRDHALPAASGVVPGTYVSIYDDLVIENPANGSEMAAAQARADERGADYLRRLEKRDRRYMRVFRDVNVDAVSLVGAQFTAATVEDRGAGMRVELVSAPDRALENWRPAAIAGRPKKTPPSGGCSPKLIWLKDKFSLAKQDLDRAPPLYAKAFQWVMVESQGRCDCIDADQGDPAARRYFAALDALAADPDAAIDPDEEGQYREGEEGAQLVYVGDFTWEATKRVSLCCGCAGMRLTLDHLATIVLGIPTFTLEISRGCQSLAPATYTMLAECGDNGWVQLAGFSEEACEGEPRDDPECDNLFRLRLRCSDCDLPGGACVNCKDGLAAGVYKVVLFGMTGANAAYNGTWYLFQDQDDKCACVYKATCGTITLTMTIGATKVLFNFGGAPGGGSGSYESGEVQPKTRNCLAPIDVTQVSGVGPGALSLVPVDCGGPKNEPTPAAVCVFGGPDLHYVLRPQGCAEKTGTMVFQDTGYADGFAWGTCVCPGNETQSHVPGELWTLTVGCSGDPENPIAGVSLGAPTGHTDPLTVTIVSVVPLLLHISGVLHCPAPPDPDGFKATPFTGCIGETLDMCVGGPHWCVLQADGTKGCVQDEDEPPTPPGGQVFGPYKTAEECEIACECVGAPGPSATAAVTASAGPAVRVTRSRGAATVAPVLLPMVCPHGGGSREGDLLRGCTTCSQNRDARHVYACDHPDNEAGECTRGNLRSGLWTCATCPHHPDAVREADADG